MQILVDKLAADRDGEGHMPSDSAAARSIPPDARLLLLAKVAADRDGEGHMPSDSVAARSIPKRNLSDTAMMCAKDQTSVIAASA